MASNDSGPGASDPRGWAETLPLQGGDCVLMVDPDAETRLACVQAAVDEGCRPLAARPETAAAVAAENRPLVIVVAGDDALGGVDPTDLAVSVGAQLVRWKAMGAPEQLAERVRLGIVAARRIRASAR